MIQDEKIKILEDENKKLKIKNAALEGSLKSLREAHEKMVADKSIPPWLRK